MRSEVIEVVNVAGSGKRVARWGGAVGFLALGGRDISTQSGAGHDRTPEGNAQGPQGPGA
jgi:hypothetical protein